MGLPPVACGLSLGTRRIAPALRSRINTAASPVAEAPRRRYAGERLQNDTAPREMNITSELAEKTLAVIADINRTQPADGQLIPPATRLESVETLAALNHAGWMKLLMEEDNWRETEGKLQELVANWIGQYRRRDLRQMAKDWVQEPEDKATGRLLELWVTEDELSRLAQLVTERKFSEPRTPVCFAIVNARTAVQSALHFMRHDRKLTPEEMDQVLRELDENKDEYDYIASLGMIDDSPE